MREFSAAAVAALALLTARPQRANEAADGPKAIFRDPFIENLAGNWVLTRRIRGREVRNRVEAGWVLNHQFLQVHMADVARPPEYEALVMIGYDHGAGKYVAHWCDTFGGKFSALGHGKRSGNSIEFAFVTLPPSLVQFT